MYYTWRLKVNQKKLNKVYKQLEWVADQERKIVIELEETQLDIKAAIWCDQHSALYGMWERRRSLADLQSTLMEIKFINQLIFLPDYTERVQYYSDRLSQL